jgi:hypothetical protein
VGRRLKHSCIECGKRTKAWQPILELHVCRSCQTKYPQYRLITKTRAAADYRLNAAELQTLRFLETRNPHYRTSAPMQLFLVSQVEELATRKWGDIVYPDEKTIPTFEGAKKQVIVNRYERNPAARQKCIEYYGHNCSVCEMNFERIYGERGKHLIHVHHVIQLSSIGESYEVDPIKDLRPICPNCHAVIHRTEPPCSIEELKKLIASNSSL